MEEDRHLVAIIARPRENPGGFDFTLLIKSQNAFKETMYCIVFLVGVLFGCLIC